ncbi:MAG TPA: MmpS family transport accessory protein [Mycobacterium sp.]|nr:MmpS family transport accessory protein [Mycobacterium sp.]
MSDPQQPGGSGTAWRGAEPAEPAQQPAYPGAPRVDPAYAGQLPAYGGYQPAQGPDPSRWSAQQHWATGQPTWSQTGPLARGAPPPRPQPPRSPRWLFLLAGAAVLLVVAMVIAMVIVNGSAKQSATPSRLPEIPAMTPAPRVPPKTIPPRLPPEILPPGINLPTLTPPTALPSPGGAPQTIVYSVTGQGRAISIAYIGTGGVLQTEFNVALPWRKQVSLASPASTVASVTVVNIGQQITCSVSVDGEEVREHTGTFLTICAAAG